MALFLFALAGIPPTVGFTTKYGVFYAAIVGGRLELAIIGVLTSVLGMFYYLRVIWAMYFVEPTPYTAAPEEPFVVAPPSEPAKAVAAAPGGGVAVAEPQTQTQTQTATETVAARATPAAPRQGVPIPAPTWLALAIAGVLTLFLGIFPGPLYDLVHEAATALFR
jgi:NADH-quinone oxidoreductase subunit N